MRRLAVLMSILLSVPPAAEAAEPGSAACKRELRGAQAKTQQSLSLLDGLEDLTPAQRCRNVSRHLDLSHEIRESYARCDLPATRDAAVDNADIVIAASETAYDKWCPPRPGHVRVRMIEVTRVSPARLPKPLRAIHRCADAPIYSINERFAAGRLVVLGCPGEAAPTPDELRARNASAASLKKEQAAVYLTRDRDGTDPHRLTFPILAADGSPATTSLLLAGSSGPGDALNEISSFWEPAKDGICRVHAVWRVTRRQAELVLWEEARQCADRPDFQPVIDRRR